MLKPYQLVGVNFMLLLHRKNVGGGKFNVSVQPQFNSLLGTELKSSGKNNEFNNSGQESGLVTAILCQ